MSIYIGENEISKKVDKIYIGQDGVAKRIIRGYVGDVNGIAKLFYQRIDTWEKCNVITEYRWDRCSISRSVRSSTRTSVYKFNNPETIKIYRTSSTSTPSMVSNYFSGFSYYAGPATSDGTTAGNTHWYALGNRPDRCFFFPSAATIRLQNNGTVDVYAGGRSYTMRYISNTYTFMDYVYSTDINAYPNGEESGNYYYRNRKITNYSKGSFIEYVEADYGTYPENGRGSDGYWYERVT